MYAEPTKDTDRIEAIFTVKRGGSWLLRVIRPGQPPTERLCLTDKTTTIVLLSSPLIIVSRHYFQSATSSTWEETECSRCVDRPDPDILLLAH